MAVFVFGTNSPVTMMGNGVAVFMEKSNTQPKVEVEETLPIVAPIVKGVRTEAEVLEAFSKEYERMRELKPRVVCRGQYGVLRYRNATWKEQRAAHMKIRKQLQEAREEEQFLATEHLVTSIRVEQLKPDMVQVRDNEPIATLVRSSRKSPRARRSVRKVSLDSKGFDNLIGAITKILKKVGKSQIEIVHKRGNRVSFARKRNQTYACLAVKHMAGKRTKRDVETTPWSRQILRMIAQRCSWRSAHSHENVERGMSGFILNPSTMKGNIGSSHKDIFIVRGKYNSRLYDASVTLSREIVVGMTHFSSVGDAFWRGFNKTFLELRQTPHDHQCESNLPVEDCGSVAAAMCQLVFPCGRITCEKCVMKFCQQSPDELAENLREAISGAKGNKLREFKQFPHAQHILSTYLSSVERQNESYAAFSEIVHIVGERKEAPISHINRLNELLIKGGRITTAEFAQAHTHLLELARFHKNRTENIKAGGLGTFRNKIASKTQINTALMCDNQLDTNGNFVWGKRGYHAKRFFSNYFEKIDPKDGYDKYVVRMNPNGSRKLAIGNLIVSTDFEALRAQLVGERIEKQGLSLACTSKRGENYIYPCCCVTYDNGEPLLSDIRIPTKNHLVIGNAGDAKYVDLPSGPENKMYIAKKGYCYINIFLAMLVNVNESRAKDFTKMVRDVLVEKLGEWPTVIDVATACHLLTVFHPETHNAELPRILVDHKAKTMHVIDSYGSITTGYHVLKANTVSQFVQFASNSLESEMKHYVVGGTDFGDRTTSVNKLIQAIYRPRDMEQLLENDPYTLIFAILSPRIIMAMYNSGSFEKALLRFGSRNMSLSSIMHLLSSLARRVSVAKSVISQFQILEANASHILELIEPVTPCGDSRGLVFTMLEVMIANREADRELAMAGYSMFRDATREHVEKIYAQELQASWDALSWCGKLRATLDARKWQKHITEQLTGVELRDSSVTSTHYWQYCFNLHKTLAFAAHAKARAGVATVVSAARNKMYKASISAVKFFAPSLYDCISFSAVVTSIVGIIAGTKMVCRTIYDLRQSVQRSQEEAITKRITKLYKEFVRDRTELPSVDEFSDFLKVADPGLVEPFYEMIESDTKVAFQAKRASEANYEKVIAFMALVMMVIDNERSDYMHKALMKVKSLMATAEQEVLHQSVDDIVENFDERNLHIDVEIDGCSIARSTLCDSTFSKWWNNQLDRNNVVPHYRTEGHFIEFTRATAAKVANDIANSHFSDFLVRGAVGSGKSTGLPFHLHTKGSVLLLEPTRPLADNVGKQLRGEPFHVSPTVRMRGMSTFGSTPITVMTSGFALHHYANNAQTLDSINFVIIDESHVHDSSSMAFVCLLREHKYAGKILKVSATPPGREVEFKTEHAVEVIPEDSLSLQEFAKAQGTGTRVDVTKHGDNILVYVASYNEVDTLSKLLAEARFHVTKVDGRTMKLGSTEITTCGTTSKKHFVVATNIIENGVTLDIDVVVDFGTKVSPTIDLDNRCIRYAKTSITYGERIQRLGRVGRFKRGAALRIGFTEKGLTQVPSIVATDAAFLCFAYNLPVMTQNVSTSLISNCTVRQARAMLLFELPIFYTSQLIHVDGSIHPAIHTILKKYKLRDSEMILSKLAIPSSNVSQWFSARDYAIAGYRTGLDDAVKIPFMARDLPDRLHGEIWDCVVRYKSDSGFGRVRSSNVCKIAYTLQTDIASVQRTVAILDELIAHEQEKQAYYRSVTASIGAPGTFSLSGLVQGIRAKYTKDYTTENIGVLQAAKAQIQEFCNLRDDATFNEMSPKFLESEVSKNGALECVLHQSNNEISSILGLKGRWNKTLITQDLLLLGGLFIGGVWMAYEMFSHNFQKKVCHQGASKRQRQKLKFRNARDQKLGREVFGDDENLTHYFGNAYAKKDKAKGKHTKGMGSTNKRFVNMYGFDPADYSFVRFLDPLTGYTIDESPHTDIRLVQEHFTDLRTKAVLNDELDRNRIVQQPGITAYYIQNLTEAALKVDLTPHNPLAVCRNSNNIAKFPEREFELRQTGPSASVSHKEIPAVREAQIEVEHEGLSSLRGLRDYNPISSVICRLENTSDGHKTSIYGLGYGSLIITNQHLFPSNNGQLVIKSRLGEHLIKNTTQLQLLPCTGRDILVIRLPKDFPPFPQRLKFRMPQPSERVCLVGSNFQDKSVTSTVSECSTTTHEGAFFWKHWIDTKDGYCGLPIVSTKDGSIVGLHSLTNMKNSTNYYASFPEDFETKFLKTPDNQAWIRGWKYNVDGVCWGGLNLVKTAPAGLFKADKLITDLETTDVSWQSRSETWVEDSLVGNLKAVARCHSSLVTKHVVRGKCQLFSLYLSTHPEARAYFTPLLGHYQKSRLNKEAYLKDILKYSAQIEVGVVDVEVFETTILALTERLRSLGLTDCEYITDSNSIFSALNMKSAVGALYSGKKQDYFRDFSDIDKEEILFQSCLRLYTGQMGVWNGSLKAELRPIAKVQAGKTRTFTAAPLDTLLGAKVCVDDFNAQFYNFNLRAPWSVGMTKFFGGWNKMLTSLPDGWLYCDADGSQFDSSLTPYLINSVLRLRLEFMEDWDIGEKMLSNLYTEIIYTPIATPDGTVVKKFRGNNSGQPSTVVDNTLMVILAMNYSLQKVGVDFEKQDDYCRYFVNGDDLLIAMRPDMEWVLDTLQQNFSQLGLKYDFTNRTTDKADVWFMSHKGKLIDGLYIPKLEEERVVSILEWDRSTEPQHRLEAICASMIEAWGYPQLVYEIRKFYHWVLEQAPYNELAKQGCAPYIAEIALRRLYTSQDPAMSELAMYMEEFHRLTLESVEEVKLVSHQAGTEQTDAGQDKPPGGGRTQPTITPGGPSQPKTPKQSKDKDVNVGTTGTFAIPRLKSITSKMSVPNINGRLVLNLDHLLVYEPEQTSLYNTRATQKQFETWYELLRDTYELTDEDMGKILNGLMVWCIENGTSPNLNGNWTMMDRDEQVEYPLKPVLENAQPTFRQIMAHFSNAAEAYIEKRNSEQRYMPRYGSQRNLNDYSLARYAFDFYEITARTPNRAREAHIQMKAAALRNTKTKLFGLDGNVGTEEEDTERHTATDVRRDMHNLLGMRI
nr:MAG: polyprotein [Potyvirus sp.]